MQELMTVIIVWLSVNFGLPASEELPSVRLMTPATMTDARVARVADTRPEAAPVADSGAESDIHAFYDDLERTIYLSDHWTADSPAEVSVLVHELVHHLQNAGGERHECPQARERVAYAAQARWLKLLGTSLEAAFGIDALTRLVRTTCVH